MNNPHGFPLGFPQPFPFPLTIAANAQQQQPQQPQPPFPALPPWMMWVQPPGSGNVAPSAGLVPSNSTQNIASWFGPEQQQQQNDLQLADPQKFLAQLQALFNDGQFVCAGRSPHDRETLLNALRDGFANNMNLRQIIEKLDTVSTPFMRAVAYPEPH